MPAMADPYFTRTLTYICEHNDQGALGVVVNRPIDMNLRSLFDRLSLPIDNDDVGDAPIYFYRNCSSSVPKSSGTSTPVSGEPAVAGLRPGSPLAFAGSESR